MERVERPQKTFKLVLSSQTKEDEDVNGTNPVISYNGNGSRFPLVLLLDRLVSTSSLLAILRADSDLQQEDTRNVGSILRTAAFFGVDAVAVSRDFT